MLRWLFAITLFSLGNLTPIHAEVIGREGQGWLERENGQLILHLKGSPREMGLQHGRLLKDHIQQNLKTLLEIKGNQALVDFGPLKLKPRTAIEAIIAIQRAHVPDWYLEEIAGLAEGAEVPEMDALVANFIPEMFHCSGFALMNSATADGTLYHGRVLDYATDWSLQDHALVLVAEPEGGIPFVNVTYAGFVGCVTGMNVHNISIGEMGGGGLGHWHGVPMAVLMRQALQTCETFDQTIDLYRTSPRTCQYFYVVADGKTNKATGMEASWDRFELVLPGVKHELLPEPVHDCALLSAGQRYQLLVERVKEQHGQITAESALKLMDRPVAMKSNLHNVLFEPQTTRFWVSHAGSDGTPAADRPYNAYQLSELLSRTPDRKDAN